MIYKRLLTQVTNKIYELPVIVMMPHSTYEETRREHLARHVEAFRQWGVRHVIFANDEALKHSNLWPLCQLLQDAHIRISLYSSGALLRKYAFEVIQFVNEVVILLDGSPGVHDQIHSDVQNAFKKISEGIQGLRDHDPSFRITARCALQRLNYNHFTDIIATAKSLELEQISFLAADASATTMLNEREVREFEKIIRESIHQFPDLFHSHYIAEPPEKILDIATWYKALIGVHDFPLKKCNAPWTSCVIEANGDVRPCPFHATYGNIHEQNFADIINDPAAVSFRKHLNVQKNSVCERCVLATVYS